MRLFAKRTEAPDELRRITDVQQSAQATRITSNGLLERNWSSAFLSRLTRSRIALTVGSVGTAEQVARALAQFEAGGV